MKPGFFKKPAAAAALLLPNLWLVRGLLSYEYLDQMGSIAGSFIGLARWIRQYWPDLQWFPLWYGGIPFTHTYPPLLHQLVALVSLVFRISPAHAYHGTVAIAYSLGPVTLFLLARRLGASRACAFASGLFYSLVSPSVLFLSALRHDAGGVWVARRLQALVQYGEGPHVTALTLLPLALWLLATAYEKRKPLWWFLAALGLASVALTNWLGSVALALAAAAWLAAANVGRRGWLEAAALAGFAYGIACRWLPPSYIRTIAENEKYLSGPLSPWPERIALILAALAVLALLMYLLRRFNAGLLLRFSVLYLVLTATITLGAGWAGVRVVAQPDRYHLEMEMALALLIPAAAWPLAQRYCNAGRIRWATVCLLALVALWAAFKDERHARRMIRRIEIEQTIEYRMARWLEENLKGRRVLAPGSTGFYLPAFADVPQLGGGMDQGHINRLWPHIYYQLLSGEGAGEKEGEIALMWLKAFGVDAICVSGPKSREFYKPFRNPHKFEGLLVELWREGDDVIYRVPRRSPSLAHVIRREDLPGEPTGGLDVAPLRPYLAALDDPSLPQAGFVWRNHHAASISAILEKEQLLSVQISYHPGWKAAVNGQQRVVRKDGLGQMLIEPRCQGRCTVEITFDGGREYKVCRLVSLGCLLLGLLWAVKGMLENQFESGRGCT